MMIVERNQCYQHIRHVLENLTKAISDTPRSVHVEHDLERSQAYLHDHCSECGDAITGAEYAQIYAQECARVGAAGVASIEARPICLVCYARLRRALAAFAPSLLERPLVAPLTPSLSGQSGTMRSVGGAPCPAADGLTARRAPRARHWRPSAAPEGPGRLPQPTRIAAQVLDVPGTPLAYRHAGITLARFADPTRQIDAKKVSH